MPLEACTEVQALPFPCVPRVLAPWSLEPMLMLHGQDPADVIKTMDIEAEIILDHLGGTNLIT